MHEFSPAPCGQREHWARKERLEPKSVISQGDPVESTQLVRLSKFLSKHLRHQPQKIGLIPEPGGWVGVEELLAACALAGLPMTREMLNEVVERNDKQRFAFDESGQKIRAQQGHSIDVDLELEPSEPPAVLYHGTGSGNVEAIQRSGLLKMRRHHVHLSADTETAIRVGSRHGKPVVFIVDAAAMKAEGWKRRMAGR
jgi:putative RNA 2'-phosphotransferase